MKKMLLSALLIAITPLTPTSAFAMTFARCEDMQWSDKDIRSYLAKQKYSPFRAMYYESYAGVLAGMSYLYESGKRYPDYVGVTSVTFLSAGAILALMANSGCTPDAESIHAIRSSVTINDLDREALANNRAGFLYVHVFNTVPVLLMTIYSGKPQHWDVFGTTVLFPFIADAFYRLIFDRERLSPVSLEPRFVFTNNEWQPVAALTYEW